MQSWSKKKWTTSLAAGSRFLLIVVCIITLLAHRLAANISPIQSITGRLYAENFTYYKLSGEGWLRLELFSVMGDVDVYVSGLTLTPSFADYELKSESCGMDMVDIHSTMNRPVGIGIYAHPSYMESHFRMDILVVEEVESDEYERLFKAFHFYDDEASMREDSHRSNQKSKALLDSDEEEKESIWWTILITILKFILEVIV